MRSRVLSNATKSSFALLADPDCQTCSGEGWVDVTWNSDPTNSYEAKCSCVQLDEPPDDYAYDRWGV